jgi:hypothetical protein
MDGGLGRGMVGRKSGVRQASLHEDVDVGRERGEGRGAQWDGYVCVGTFSEFFCLVMLCPSKKNNNKQPWSS